jgi:hypothetical protein
MGEEMNTSVVTRTRLIPASEEERQLVRAELATVLASPHFSTSKRYPALLQYIVEKTLDGKSDDIKERTLGIDVFHRPHDFDTSSDTIVRFSASEVRKRLALVYHESVGLHTVQIVLPLGSYVPDFLVADKHELHPAALTAEAATERESLHSEAATSRLRRFAGWRLAAVLIGVLLAVGVGGWLLRHSSAARQSSLERFWLPVRSASAPTLICAGALVPSVDNHSGFTVADQQSDYPYVSMMTARVLISLSDLFAKSHTQYMVQPVSSITLADMREHPTVLIGAYDNKWTVLLLNDLRFRFAARPALRIDDITNPSSSWTRQDSLPYKNQDDYAVVARFHDKLTDNMVVVIAGIGKNGTEAAAQFVASSHYLDLLDQRSKDWSSKNIEVVLKTAVIDGKSGAPTIEAFYAW